MAAAQPIAVALAHHQAGELDKAEALYRAIVAAEPANFDAVHLLGVLLLQSARLEQAIAQLERAVALGPGVGAAHRNLAEAYRVSGRASQAIESFSRAVSLEPQPAAIHFYLGTLLAQESRLGEAVASLRRAIELKPDLPEAHYNLGNAYRDQGDRSSALAAYRRAIGLRPAFAEAHLGAGTVLREQGELDRAAESLERAMQLDPRLAEAHEELGNVRTAVGDWREALACFRRASELDPGNARPRWAAAMAQIPALAEPGVEAEERRLAFARELGAFEEWLRAEPRRGAYRAVGAQQPFYLAYQETSNRDLLARYGALCGELMRTWPGRAGIAPRRAHKGAIRIGIVSAHVFNHSVWSALTRGWVERLARGRFELHLFNLGARHDEESERARRGAERYHEGVRSFEQWAEIIHAAEPDVLVYPEVGMDATTAKLASLRLAPAQAASWGHPETTGMPSMDYYLSGEALEPQGAEAHYTESLVRLPGLGCCIDPAPPAAPAPAMALDGSPLLVCPGTPFKYGPRDDAAFAAIVKRLPQCRLVFFRNEPSHLSRKFEGRLRLAFAAAGADFERHVRFVPWQGPAAFRALLERSDLYLDSLGFSGFNTALVAIECGLPIVAREGRFLRSRLASGLLRRLALDELVAPTDEAYVELAVGLANDAPRRAALRHRMPRALEPLYGDSRPAAALADFFERAARR